MEHRKTQIEYEKDTVRKMIELYCRTKHQRSTTCDECSELVYYAEMRLKNCKFSEVKPTCAQCSVHCYKPEMRERIKEVMRFSGPRMILHHPIDAVKHLVQKLRG